MIEKTRLATAVAVALGATVAAVQADNHYQTSAMFPTLVVSPTVTTVVSVINDGYGLEDQNGKELLHYTYWYKGLNAGESLKDFNEKECVERNRYLPTSKYDIQTFDVSGSFFGVDAGDKGIMFLDPSVNNDWTDTSQDWQFGKTPDIHRAVLFVDNYKTAGQGSWDEGSGEISGEAILFEVANGASWGYRALERHDDDGRYGHYASDDQSQVPFMPPAEVTTMFLVTPVVAYTPKTIPGTFYKKPDYDQIKSQGELMAYIGVRGLDEKTPGVFGRDEEFLSGGIDRKVTCVGGWSLPDLYPDAIDPPNEVPGGGWTHITNYTKYEFCNLVGGCIKTDTFYPAAIVYKVEYGVVSDLDDGAAAGNDGVYNNGLYLHPDYDYCYDCD